MLKALLQISAVVGLMPNVFASDEKDYVVFKGLPKYETADVCGDEIDKAIKTVKDVLGEGALVEGRCREFRQLDKTFVWHLKIDDSKSPTKVNRFSHWKDMIEEKYTRVDNEIYVDKFGELKTREIRTLDTKQKVRHIESQEQCTKFGKAEVERSKKERHYRYLAFDCTKIAEGDERTAPTFEIIFTTFHGYDPDER